MAKIFLVFICIVQLTLVIGCPTCIGLPRAYERPFFERKSFLAALAQPQSKQQAPAPKKVSGKKQHEKTPQ